MLSNGDLLSHLSQLMSLHYLGKHEPGNCAPERLLHCRPTLMVSVPVSKLGCTELVFVEPGMKVDSRYYREVLLKKQMLPIMRCIAGDTYVFQQDGAPAHRARETVQLLQQETPQFISPDLWPPNSPNLNPVDYRIWGWMQERVQDARPRHRRLEEAPH